MSFYDFPIYHPAQDLITSDPRNSSTGSISIYVNEGEYLLADQELLKKIIGATGNDLSNIHVSQVKSEEYIALQQSWNNQKGLDLIFGVNSSQLMLQCETHQYYPIHIGKRTLLFCDSLTTLIADGDKKKALWGCLKTYFEL